MNWVIILHATKFDIKDINSATKIGRIPIGHHLRKRYPHGGFEVGSDSQQNQLIDLFDLDWQKESF